MKPHMTSRVDFAFGASHRLRMGCEVVHKHYLAGRSVVVYTQDAQRLSTFDRLLWSYDPLAFIPHVYTDDPLAASTPIILTTAPPVAPESLTAQQDVWLLNLDLACPPNAQAFSRILEIVSGHEQDKAAARERWLAYKAQGYDVRAHDVSGLAAQ